MRSVSTSASAFLSACAKRFGYSSPFIYMAKAEALAFLCITFLACSKSETRNEPAIVSTATISSTDQQTIKGWGCCPIWIGNHDLATQPLTEQATFQMGATLIRLSQLANTGDSLGNINSTGADELCRAIAITAKHGLPYVLSSWSPPDCMKTIAIDGSVSNDSLVHLQPSKEQAYAGFIVKLMDYISITKGLPLPVAYSFQNEPTCQTPWAGCIYNAAQYQRVAKLVRSALDSAGYRSLFMLGPEDGGYNNGQGWNWSYGLLGGAGFPALQDSAFNKAIGAFASHSYDWAPYTSSANYDRWISGCDTWGKDRWQTEYCYIEDTSYPHVVGTVRRFISDLSYLKNNYWFTWTVNEGWGNDVPDALCFGDGVNNLTRKPAYYVLKKLFTVIPIGSMVRKMSSTDNRLITDNAGRMDMVAFKSDTSMVAVMVNPTLSDRKTNIAGLVGSKAHIYQMATSQNNTDLSLIGSPVITNGSITNIDLPANSVSIVVTSFSW